MLQYAVDTHLDELLAAIWLQVTNPPQPLNPYPRVLNIIRWRRGTYQGGKRNPSCLPSAYCLPPPHTPLLSLQGSRHQDGADA
jgi:hypothetical protein